MLSLRCLPIYTSRGFWACATRAIPACSVMFTTVDIVRENLSVFLADDNNDRSPRPIQRVQQSSPPKL